MQKLLDGCHPLFKEYLHKKYPETAPRNRQMFEESLRGGKVVKTQEIF